MDLLKPLVALLAVVNPVGVLPFFIHFTQAFNQEQRRHTIRVSALAAGLVVIARDIAPINEFVGEDVGLLLDFDGSESEAGKLSKFLSRLEHNWESMSRNCRARSLQFSWQSRMDEFQRHYLEVLAEADNGR